MATNIEELVLTLKSDVSGFRSDIKKAQGTLSQFTAKTEKGMTGLSKKVNVTSLAFANFAGNLASSAFRSALSGLTRGLRVSFDAMVDFEKGISEINTILPANAQLTKKSEEAIRSFSSQYGSSATKQAKAYYDIVSAGISGTANQMDLLDAANKAAIAGVTEVGVAVDVMTSALNVYGNEAYNASKVSDILFTAVRLGKTTFSEIGSRIGLVLPQAKALNINLEELSATLAFLTAKGIRTAQGVTALKAVFLGILKPTSEAKEEIERLNSVNKELQINFSKEGITKAGGFIPFLQQIIKATNGSSDSITKLFGSAEALTGILSIVADEGKKATEFIDEMGKSAGASSVAFEKMANTLSFKLNRAKQVLINFGAQWAMVFQDEIKRSLDFLVTDGLKIINAFVSGAMKALSTLVTGFKIAANTIIAFVNQIGDAFMLSFNLITFNLKGVVQSFKNMVGNFTGLGKSIKKNAKDWAEFNKSVSKTKNSIDAIAEGFKSKKPSLTPEIDPGIGGIESVAAALEKKELQTGAMGLAPEKTITSEKSELEYEAKKQRAKKELEDLLMFGEEKSEILKNNYQKELDLFQEYKDSEIISEEQHAQAIMKINEKLAQGKENILNEQLGNISSFFNDYASLAKSGGKNLFGISKGFAIASATIDGYRAVQKALANPPGPPFNYIAVAGALARTTANIVGIKRQSFKEGLDEVPGTESKDHFPALLAGGEGVLDAKTNKDLKTMARNFNDASNFKNMVKDLNKETELNKDSLDYISMANSIANSIAKSINKKNNDKLMFSDNSNIRGQGSLNNGEFNSLGTQKIEITLKDDLVEFIEAKLVERERVGLSIRGEG